MTMQKTLATAPAPPGAGQSIFDRILVCVDGTTESLDACRQAHALAERHSTVAAAFASLYPAGEASTLGADELAERLDHAVSSSLAAAEQILGPHAELRRLHGLPVEALLGEAKRIEATLLAIGTHGHDRLEEIALGGVAGELLHRAPCAVLVARPVPDLDAFPREIVVGVDGSPQAEIALAAARTLASRRHGRLRRVVAYGGKRIDLGPVAKRHPHIEAVAAAPVPALVDASACADLLVVGSRGLHGVRALGSVSERVAHDASCSVLVVR